MKYKVIQTKNITEVMTYQRLNISPPQEGIQNGEGLYREENYKKTQKSRRDTIRRLVTQNFETSDLFITLTFNNKQEIDIKNPKETNRLFNRFTTRLGRRYKNLIGIAVIEFQDKNGRGAVHYHMVIKGVKYIAAAELEKIWKYGFVKINAIDKVDNIGAYVIKYMNKDLDDTRLQDCKAYLTIGKLEKPRILKSWNRADTQELQRIDLDLKEKSPIYSAEYTSDNAGLVTYLQYNSNR